LANLCGRADLADRCAGEINRGYNISQIILFMIFILSLRAVDAADCPHFKEDKHQETKGKTGWKKFRSQSLVEL
jgi:hypothetical protein